MHVIEDVVNDRDSKAKEGMKKLEKSWEGLTRQYKSDFHNYFSFSIYHEH